MDGTEAQVGGWRHETITEGEWAGWILYGEDPFEAHAGPFYYRPDADGRPVCAFRAEHRHMNGGGFMHGGAMMTFADYCIFVFAREALTEQRAVTATFNSEFVGAVLLGSIVECRGEVVKAGRSMVFVRGLMTVEGDPVLAFSATIKKTAPRTRP
jgi:uncharacterized protein (TIGR00369 family)